LPEEFRSGLSLRVAQGTPRFCGATNPGRLFFGSFLLAKQKKGTSRRAAPGFVNQLLMVNTYGASCFDQRAARAMSFASFLAAG